jgi:hypothetical protein
MDELADQSSWQLGRTESGLEFAEVVTGRAGLQQPSGPQNSPAKGSDHAEPTASSEVAIGRMSLGDMSGLCVACLTAHLQAPKWPLIVSVAK